MARYGRIVLEENLTTRSGPDIAPNSPGKDLVIITGEGDTNQNSGNIFIQTNNSLGTGLSGNISIFTGDSPTSSSGQIQIRSGDCFFGSSTGNIEISTGSLQFGTSGYISISTGNATNSGNSGDLILRTGNVDVFQFSGDINIQPGEGGGNVNIFGSDSFSPRNQNGGNVFIRGGDSEVLSGGLVVISGGSNINSSGTGGGSVTIEGGLGNLNAGGDVVIRGGDGASLPFAIDGGNVNIFSGLQSLSGGGNPGNINITARRSDIAGYNSGNVSITVEDSTNTSVSANISGGNIILRSGAGSPSGDPGRIYLRVPEQSSVDLQNATSSTQSPSFRYFNSTNTNWISFRSPNVLSSNYNYVLPPTSPSQNGFVFSVENQVPGSIETAWVYNGRLLNDFYGIFEDYATILTTTNTLTNIFIVPPQPERTVFIEAYIVAQQISAPANNSAAYIRRGRAYYNASSVPTLGGVTGEYTNETVAAWDATIQVVSNNVAVRVLGSAGVTIRWFAHIKMVYSAV